MLAEIQDNGGIGGGQVALFIGDIIDIDKTLGDNGAGFIQRGDGDTADYLREVFRGVLGHLV